MLSVPDPVTAGILVAALLVAPLAWMYLRRQKGFPALATVESRRRREAAALLNSTSGIRGTL
jgi:hypothetical protein